MSGPGPEPEGAPLGSPDVRVLVVVPTYNEAGNLVGLLERVRAAAPDAEVLIVDDGSPDGTADLAEKTGERIGKVSVLRRDAKRGLGDAYRAGFRWGLERGFTVLIEMDADLSHDPDRLPALIAGTDNADLVIGSRYMPGGSVSNWALHRRLLSLVGNRYSALVLGVRVRDLTSGYRAFQHHALEAVDLDSVRAEGYGFQIEMAYRVAQAGGRIAEIPIHFVDREVGDSKMSTRIAAEALLLVTWWGLARTWRRDRLWAARLAGQARPPGSDDRAPSR